MAYEISLISNIVPEDKLCEACIYGKHHKLSFNKSKEKSPIMRSLFNVHSDVCDPITPPTIDDKRYFVIYIDEYTHYCVTYLIAHKSDVFSTFKDFTEKSQTHFNLRIANLYVDNAKEYFSNEMKQYCVNNGTSFHPTIPYTPELNGMSERMNRTIVEKARSMIKDAKLPQQFWGEAVLTATKLIKFLDLLYTFITNSKSLNLMIKLGKVF